MKVTSKNYDGKLYIKLGRKHIPLEETVEYFENLEKENEQLKQQIEKMKNCKNCNEYRKFQEFNTITSKCFDCKNKSNWELADDRI